MTKKKRMKSKIPINLLTDNDWFFVNKSSEIPFINVFKINIKGKLVTINTTGVNESLENVFV